MQGGDLSALFADLFVKARDDCMGSLKLLFEVLLQHGRRLDGPRRSFSRGVDATILAPRDAAQDREELYVVWLGRAQLLDVPRRPTMAPASRICWRKDSGVNNQT